MIHPQLSLNKTTDTCIGILLSFCSVIGIIFNVPSVTYFLTQSPRNNNASYFQRIYQIISMIDLFICLTLFPYIDVAFARGRRSRLLKNGTVCSIWSIFWTVLPEMSVFMVAFISVSRLLLLMNPHRVFKPLLGWLDENNSLCNSQIYHFMYWRDKNVFGFTEFRGRKTFWGVKTPVGAMLWDI